MSLAGAWDSVLCPLHTEVCIPSPCRSPMQEAEPPTTHAALQQTVADLVREGGGQKGFEEGRGWVRAALHGVR